MPNSNIKKQQQPQQHTAAATQQRQHQTPTAATNNKLQPQQQQKHQQQRKQTSTITASNNNSNNKNNNSNNHQQQQHQSISNKTHVHIHDSRRCERASPLLRPRGLLSKESHVEEAAHDQVRTTRRGKGQLERRAIHHQWPPALDDAVRDEVPSIGCNRRTTYCMMMMRMMKMMMTMMMMFVLKSRWLILRAFLLQFV